MCGIFLNMDTQVEQKFMDNMFVMDALRGKDSCGLITVTVGEAEVYKDAVPALEFIKDREYDKLYWKNTLAAIGHNRAATAGAVNKKNAHPFVCGNITGVHNGTLMGQWRLPDSEKFSVDSENIMHSIDKIGIDETWKLIDGAAALMWFDEAEQTINVIRNDERDLYMTIGPRGEVYMASEKFMMLAAMERNHLVWGDVDIVPVNTLFTIDIKTRKVESRVLEEGSFPYSYSSHNYGAIANIGDGGGNRGGFPVNFIVDYIEHGAICTYYYVSDVRTKSNLYYTLEDYQNVLKLKEGDKGSSTVVNRFKGEVFLSIRNVIKEVEDTPADDDGFCHWCSSPIKAGERYTIDADGSLFCSMCSQNDAVKEYIGDQSEELIA